MITRTSTGRSMANGSIKTAMPITGPRTWLLCKSLERHRLRRHTGGGKGNDYLDGRKGNSNTY